MEEITIEEIEIACDEFECRLINLMDNLSEYDYLNAKLTLDNIREMIKQLMDEEYE